MKYIFLAIGLVLKVIGCLIVSVLFYGFLTIGFSLHLLWNLNFKKAREIFEINFSERESTSNPVFRCDVYITPYDYFFGKTVEFESKDIVSFFNH